MSDSILLKRHSGRSYLERAIPQDVLDRILEKIRWSPSCANAQPWRLVFVSDQSQKDKVAEALPRGNQWAAQAPIMVAICGRESDDHSREDNQVKYYQFDCGMACLSLLLAAVEEGLMGHPMAGYDASKMKTALDVPDDYDVICMVALGYEGSVESLDERNAEKEKATRTRKAIEEIIAFDRFSF